MRFKRWILPASEPFKITCFKLISQVFLDDAQGWSDTGKNMPHLWLMNLQISQSKYTLF